LTKADDRSSKNDVALKNVSFDDDDRNVAFNA
jgi:hypothetical protein